ncbi:MAG TPA: LysE family translocator [Allosphingosinicella sp.]|jgi:threonine/homoserine/homoserine lactone efflux protein|nr:LysE family translocator [Allosphingosinicella sp.]
MSPLDPSLIAFALAAALLTVTPGLDTALVLRTAAAEGPRRALAASLGICLGCLAWGALVAAGLGILLQASELAYLALKWIGAAYLLYLGLRMIFAPRPDEAGDETETAARANWFLRGLLTNLLNPKVGAFYVSFLPQFVPAGASVPSATLLLAAIHAGLGLLWFLLLIGATRPLAGLLRNPVLVRRLDRATGAVLIFFGLRLAFGRH